METICILTTGGKKSKNSKTVTQYSYHNIINGNVKPGKIRLEDDCDKRTKFRRKQMREPVLEFCPFVMKVFYKLCVRFVFPSRVIG